MRYDIYIYIYVIRRLKVKMTGAEIKNMWSSTSIHLYSFMAWIGKTSLSNFFYRILANDHEFAVSSETKYCACLSVGSCL